MSESSTPGGPPSGEHRTAAGHRRARHGVTATVARRYYLDGASKSEIAAELGLSRFKVARMLDRARTSGLVRIELHYEGEIDLDLSVRLGTQYGLRRCLVIDSPEDDERCCAPTWDGSRQACWPNHRQDDVLGSPGRER